MKLLEKLQSRKFWLSCVIMLVATVLVCAPLFGLPVILSGALWVSTAGLVLGTYIAGNVFQHRGMAQTDNSEDINITVIKGDEEGEA